MFEHTDTKTDMLFCSIIHTYMHAWLQTMAKK